MNNYAKRNWTEYNRNLVNRGSITFWLNKECLDHWISKTTKPGRPAFSKEVILAGLIIETVYDLPFRALQDLPVYPTSFTTRSKSSSLLSFFQES